jgi:hypothetical protein
MLKKDFWDISVKTEQKLKVLFLVWFTFISIKSLKSFFSKKFFFDTGAIRIL